MVFGVRLRVVGAKGELPGGTSQPILERYFSEELKFLRLPAHEFDSSLPIAALLLSGRPFPALLVTEPHTSPPSGSSSAGQR